MWGKFLSGFVPPVQLFISKVCGIVKAGESDQYAPCRWKEDLEYYRSPRGWDSRLDFKTLEEAQCASCLSKAPIMVMVHQPNDKGACDDLKARVTRHGKLPTLCKNLIFVNVTEEQLDSFFNCNPQAALQFRPDGKYVPRILFFSPSCGRKWHLMKRVHSDFDLTQRYRYVDEEELFEKARKVYLGQ